ncbi:MAG: twin-arginine translocase subunit TatC [bacterium]|nr:twin-arginine translocase subunit TatC [bacterium]
MSTDLKFWDHVDELRKRLIRAVLGVLVGAAGGLYYSEQLLAWLTQPFRDALPANAQLAVLTPTEGFNVYILVGLYGGVIVALPWVFYQLWGFVAPALYPTERRLVVPLVLASTLLFLLGAGMCWWLLPQALAFLAGFSTGNSTVFWSLDTYVTFVVLLAVAFGVCFQLPIVMAVLIKIDLVSPETFRHYRRIAYVIIVIIAAIVTPTTDIFTLSALSIPLIVLYEASIIFGSLWQRRSSINSN